jgi:Adenylate and Guanylate cyclase catalytic domain
VDGSKYDSTLVSKCLHQISLTLVHRHSPKKVTNCVKKQENDHVERIAKFSLGAIKAANETLIDEEDPSMGTIQIRVGFHCGPVVATVIGNVAPRFSLIGDTINTASRMESASEPGRIHLSEVAATLLREQAPHLTTICRGTRHIKGKGIMTTYFLEDSNVPDAPRVADPRITLRSSSDIPLSDIPTHSVTSLEAREEKYRTEVRYASDSTIMTLSSDELSSDMPSEYVQLPSEYVADSEVGAKHHHHLS